MQFKIFSLFALATLATALPSVGKRTDSQEAANQCSQSQTLKCCDSLVSGVGVILGVNCVNINCKSSFQDPHGVDPYIEEPSTDEHLIVAAVLQGQCQASQKLACCSSGDNEQVSFYPRIYLLMFLNLTLNPEWCR